MDRFDSRRRVPVEEALGAVPRSGGERSHELFRHGSMQLKAYAPERQDSQSPHARDEIYIVICGRGTFRCDQGALPFGPGDPAP